jgi:hypothetical protein
LSFVIWQICLFNKQFLGYMLTEFFTTDPRRHIPLIF